MSDCWLLVEIRNWSVMERLYGPQTTQVVARAFHERLRRSRQVVSQVGHLDRQRFVVTVGLPTSERGVMGGRQLDEILERVLTPAVGASDAGDARGWCADLSVQRLGRRVCSTMQPMTGPMVRGMLGLGDHTDVALVARLRDAVEHDRFMFSHRPICSIDDARSILYDSRSAYLIDDKGERVAVPEDVKPVLERFVMIRYLERYFVEQAVAWLRANPERAVGVGVSAQTAVIDVWWGAVFAELAKTPHIAHRFFIEIPERAPVARGGCRHLVQHLKQLGCHVVLDDFGVSYGIDVDREIRSPDVIKLDGRFVECGGNTMLAQRRLDGMASIARSLAPQVVATGVTRSDQLAMVRHAGVRWMQMESASHLPSVRRAACKS